MKTLLCLAGCLGSFSICAAQSQFNPLADGAYSVRFTNPFSFLSNTASLAICSRAAAGVMAENKYRIKELNDYTAAAQMPLANAAMGLVTSWSGSRAFSKSQLGLAYARSLGRIAMGVRFNYTLLRIEGYGSDGALSFEVGTTWKITDKFSTGVQLTNPYGGKFGENSNQKLPSLYSMGAGYECSQQLFISAIITKEENKPLNLRVAVQYIIGNRLFTMLSVNSAIASPLAAAGWLWKNMRVLISSSYHLQLGASTGIGIIFYGSKKEEEQ